MHVIFDEYLGNLSNTFAKYYSTNPTYYIPCFYHTFFPFWQHPIFSSLSYNRSWCIFSVCFLSAPLFSRFLIARGLNLQVSLESLVRFQPLVSCWKTYQDAVFVPCLGDPFIRCIWTVGIKKFAVTVPTLRPLRLLEIRKSTLCVCPLTTSPGFLVASLLFIRYWSTRAISHAISLPLISHCFETRWQMCSFSFSSSPLEGLHTQYAAPLPASDVLRDFS